MGPTNVVNRIDGHRHPKLLRPPFGVGAFSSRLGADRPIECTPGGVMLMHAHGEYTVPGLQQVINAVRAKNLTLPRRK